MSEEFSSLTVKLSHQRKENQKIVTQPLKATTKTLGTYNAHGVELSGIENQKPFLKWPDKTTTLRLTFVPRDSQLHVSLQY